MSLGGRLFRVLRANVGHAVRKLGRSDSVDPEPEYADFDPGAPYRGGQNPRSRVRAAAATKRREELEQAYRALELSFGAEPDEIRSAHRRLMRQYHPDRFAQEPERLADATRLSQELSVARDTLIEAHELGQI